jgi:putative glycosyltransferase (TIGR04372 family)
MEHRFVSLPRRRVLLVDVHESPDGKGIGYGMMLIRMRRALVVGQMLGVHVYFVPSRKALSAVVTRLECDDPVIISPDSWTGRALTALWRVAAPFRLAHPWLWVRRSIARPVVGPFYEAIERSTRLPRRLRRFLLQRRSMYRYLKRAVAAYGARSEARWQRVYHGEAIARLRALEDEGREAPPIRLRLPAAREEATRREAAALGIDPSRPIVTVHVRESGYRSMAGLRQRSWDDVRNARIETFFPAFRTLAERGYVVVRLGDPSMTPVRMPGVVDLATAPGRSQWLEVWCTMRSEFLVGCDSGPSWLAVLLGVPVLTVNAVHFRDLARPFDRAICKLARDRTTGATLSVSEMLTEDFLRVGFKSDRFDCIDNTPADLRRAVLDMIEVVHGREQRSSWQQKFNRQLRQVERQRLGGRSALEGVAIMSRARGTLSRGFAKRYYAADAACEQVSTRAIPQDRT